MPVDSLQAAALLDLGLPPVDVVARGIVGLPPRPVAHPPAGALAPPATDPLRRYPKPANPAPGLGGSRVIGSAGCRDPNGLAVGSALLCAGRFDDQLYV